MIKVAPSPLGKAVTVSMRVLADNAARWFASRDRDACAAAWSRRGCLVIVAVGDRAHRIAGELERAGLAVPQEDRPEHLNA